MSWRETKIKRLIKIYVIKVSLISEINKICAYQKSIGGDSVFGSFKGPHKVGPQKGGPP